MDKKLVIYVWKSKAYLPTYAMTQDGIGLAMLPVIVCDVILTQLSSSIQLAFERDNMILPRLHYLEAELKTKPLLDVMGAKSWSHLSRSVTTFSLTIEGDIALLNQAERDSQNKGTYNSSKAKSFVLNSDLPDNLAKAIIADLSAS